MANEFSRLSPEQVRQFNNAISEAKDLTNLQVEIINKVIEGETDIGKLRITYLEKYFDTYSSRLDQIARKHSQLNEAFLILEHQLAENYQNTVNNQESLRTNYSNGNNNYSTNTKLYIRPTLYLVSNVQITGGKGTSTDPYTFEL